MAVSGDGISWLLLNASPDLRQQVLATPALHPREGKRDTPIAGVFLTNGDVDHIAGLLSLRERQAFVLYGSAAVLDLIARDPAFAVLDRSLVESEAVAAGASIEFSGGLTVRPFLVPGKVPLFLEGESVEIGAETEMTVGLDIRSEAGRLVYIPGCASVSSGVLAQVAGADVLVFDGTTYTDDEMLRLGLSGKTARRMGHIAMSGSEGSVAAFAGAPVGRKIYTHVNNTNPVLVAGSPERAMVEAAGWEVAFDGMEIAL